MGSGLSNTETDNNLNPDPVTSTVAAVGRGFEIILSSGIFTYSKGISITVVYCFVNALSIQNRKAMSRQTKKTEKFFPGFIPVKSLEI